MEMTQSATRTITLHGKPLHLYGQELHLGAQAPDAVLVSQDLSEVMLSTFFGTPLLIATVPSLDTPVCDLEAQRFNEEAVMLANAKLITISMDLPFAQKRWCGAAGIDALEVVSDHRDADFGRNYGVLIESARILARAIFVIDARRRITYTEIVPELSAHPDYDAALAALNAL